MLSRHTISLKRRIVAASRIFPTFFRIFAASPWKSTKVTKANRIKSLQRVSEGKWQGEILKDLKKSLHLANWMV